MVDILLASYNGEKYIGTQIDSILWQSYEDWHLYIRDDGSTDGTVKIIERYCEHYPGKITFIQDQKGRGNLTHNFFELLQYASGEYVMFSDQDDIWYAHKLQTMITKAKKYDKEKPLLLCSGYSVVDQEAALKEAEVSDIANGENIVVQNGTDTSFNLLNNVYRGCTMLLNRSLYSKLGAYDSKIVMHDWWAVLVAGVVGQIYYLDTPLILYRRHTANTVGLPDARSLQYAWRKMHDPDTKQLYMQYYDQARLLYKRYKSDMDDDTKRVLLAFIHMQKTNKVRRIIITFKYHFWKNSFLRRLGQLYYL